MRGRAHRRPDAAQVVRRCEFGDDAARHEHDDAIADVEEFVEIRGDHEYPGSTGARFAQRRPNELRRRDVEAAGRLRGDDQRRGGIDFAGENHLLRVASGERAGGLVDRVVAHVPAVERGTAFGAQPAWIDRAQHLARGQHAGRPVLPERARQAQPFDVALERNDAQPARAPLEQRRVRHVETAEVQLSGFEAREAGQRVDQGALAVPLDAGDADDLAPADAQIDRVEPRAARIGTRDRCRQAHLVTWERKICAPRRGRKGLAMPAVAASW